VLEGLPSRSTSSAEFRSRIFYQKLAALNPDPDARSKWQQQIFLRRAARFKAWES